MTIFATSSFGYHLLLGVNESLTVSLLQLVALLNLMHKDCKDLTFLFGVAYMWDLFFLDWSCSMFKTIITNKLQYGKGM